MKEHWKKRALSVISVLLVVSLMSSGLSVVASGASAPKKAENQATVVAAKAIKPTATFSLNIGLLQQATQKLASLVPKQPQLTKLSGETPEAAPPSDPPAADSSREAEVAPSSETGSTTESSDTSTSEESTSKTEESSVTEESSTSESSTPESSEGSSTGESSTGESSTPESSEGSSTGESSTGESSTPESSGESSLPSVPVVPEVPLVPVVPVVPVPEIEKFTVTMEPNAELTELTVTAGEEATAVASGDQLAKDTKLTITTAASTAETPVGYLLFIGDKKEEITIPAEAHTFTHTLTGDLTIKVEPLPALAAAPYGTEIENWSQLLGLLTTSWGGGAIVLSANFPDASTLPDSTQLDDMKDYVGAGTAPTVVSKSGGGTIATDEATFLDLFETAKELKLSNIKLSSNLDFSGNKLTLEDNAKITGDIQLTSSDPTRIINLQGEVAGRLVTGAGAEMASLTTNKIGSVVGGVTSSVTGDLNVTGTMSIQTLAVSGTITLSATTIISSSATSQSSPTLTSGTLVITGGFTISNATGATITAAGDVDLLYSINSSVAFTLGSHDTGNVTIGSTTNHTAGNSLMKVTAAKGNVYHYGEANTIFKSDAGTVTVNDGSKINAVDAQGATVTINQATSTATPGGNLTTVLGNVVNITSNFEKGIGLVGANASLTMNGTGEYDDVYTGGNLLPKNAKGYSIPTGTIENLYYGSNFAPKTSADQASGEFKIGNISVNHLYLGGGDGNTVIPGTIGSLELIVDPAVSLESVHLGGSGGDVTVPVSYELIGNTVGNIYGGGSVSGKVSKGTITLTTGSVTNVYGGGEGSSTVDTVQILTSEETGPPVKITALSGTIYGGGTGTGAVGSTTIDINHNVFTATTGGPAIYGGGADGSTGAVTAAVVNINANLSTIERDIHGGGNGSGVVTTTTVNINQPVGANIYGGGTGLLSPGNLVGTSNINILAPLTAANTVYGGGSGNNGKNLTESTNVTLNAETKANIYGGGNGAAAGTTNVIVSGASPGPAGSVAGADVYGGGLNSETATGTTVIINGTTTGRVFGGGHGASASIGTDKDTPGNGTKVYINNPTVTGPIYGGGESTGGKAKVFANTYVETNVSLADAVIYGGGLNADVGGLAEVKVNKGTTVSTISQPVYGGGHALIGASTTSSTKVHASGTAVGDVIFSSSVYGGGHGVGDIAAVNGLSFVELTGASVANNIYGGGHAAGGSATSGTSTVTLNTVKMTGAAVGSRDIYGGGHGQTGTLAQTNGLATVGLTSVTTADFIYGGGFANGAPSHVGSTNVTLTTTTSNEAVYGGGHAAGAAAHVGTTDGSTIITDSTGTTSVTIASDSAIGVATADPVVPKNLYGGGRAIGGNADVRGTAKIAHSGTVTGYVYGGGHGTVTGFTSTTGNAIVGITSGSVGFSVYGGGFAAESAATIGTTTAVTISGTSPIGLDVYGGGHAVKGNANVGGLATTNISGATTIGATSGGYVYGGGHGQGASTITSAITATVDSTSVTVEIPIPKSVYGGGFAENKLSPANVTNETTVSVGEAAASTVTQNVFGGGHAFGANATANSTSVTIGASGIVTLDIYGGGNAPTSGHSADILGSGVPVANPTTYVLLSGQALAGVYGGGISVTGSSAKVMGNTSVEINSGFDPTVGKDIYGGGHNDLVTGNTKVEVKNAKTINSNIYGGGRAETKPAKVDGNTSVTVESTTEVVENIYGGGRAEVHAAEVTGNTTVTATVAKVANIYGGGRAETEVATVDGTTSVSVSGSPAISGSVYGGGFGEAKAANVGSTASVSVASSGVAGSVYGGGNAAVTAADATIGGMTTVSVIGSTVDDSVYGGGNAFAANATIGTTAIPASPRTATSMVTISDTTVTNNIYGGGFATVGNATTLKGGTIVLVDTNSAATNVYGGGRNGSPTINLADIEGGTNVSVTKSIIRTNIYGGGFAEQKIANVKDGATVNVTAGTTAVNVYGGGHAAADQAHIGQGTTVTVSDSDMTENVYGGGFAALAPANVGANAVVTVDGTSAAQNVYGGGHAAATGATAPIGTGTTVSVALTSGTGITTGIYGGGFAEAAAAHVTTGDAKVTVSEESKVGGSVYGGGHGTGADAHILAGNTTVTAQNSADITGSVYGGGHGMVGEANIAAGGTTVVVENDAKAAYVYGGGQAEASVAHISQGTNVAIKNSAAIDKSVYGGGFAQGADANIQTLGTIVTVDDSLAGTPTVGDSVYGGGYGLVGNANVKQGAVVTLTGGLTITGFVYGGGQADAGTANLETGSSSVTIQYSTFGDPHIVQSVYGGGFAENNDANVALSATVAIQGTDKDNRALIDGDIFGGGNLVAAGKSALIGQSGSGNTLVTINAAYVDGNVHGGGQSAVSADFANAQVNGTSTVTLNTNDHEENCYTIGKNVYGGGDNASIQKTTLVTIGMGAVDFDVFGGGLGNAPINNGTPTEIVAVVSTVKIQNHGLHDTDCTVEGSVYGGGHGNGAHIYGSTKLELKPNSVVVVDAYGGGRGNLVKDVYTAGGSADTNDIKGTTNVVIHGYVGNNAYGGGEHLSHVRGIQGTTILLNEFGYVGVDLHGGGQNSIVDKYTRTTVAAGGTVHHDVYGGTANTDPAETSLLYVGEDTQVMVRGYVDNNAYGGGNNSETRGSKGTTVDVYGNVVHSVFGGGNLNAEVLGIAGTTVTIQNKALIGDRFTVTEANKKLESTYTRDYNDTTRGNVYGGGFTKSNVTNAAGQGTNVHVKAGGVVTGVVYGGGYGSDIIAKAPVTGGATVKIEGYIGMVHGGGRIGRTSDTTMGSDLLVTGPTAIVFFDAYGGGLGNGSTTDIALNKQAKVLVNNKSNVRYRLFGGGNLLGAETTGATDVKVSDTGTVIGHNENLYDGNQNTAYITGWKKNIEYGDTPFTKEFFLYGSTPADHNYETLGSVFGGGNNTDVRGGTATVIGKTGQNAYNFVSGGNINVKSTSPTRTLVLQEMGTGNMSAGDNGNLDRYGVIRMLQDYTTADINNSYLTVYYNVVGVNSDQTALLSDTSYGSAGPFTNLYNVNGGVYHPWRPIQHTDIRVEPRVNFLDHAKMRMHFGYIINYVSSAYPESTNPSHKISLFMDLKVNPASTSMIFTPIESTIDEFAPFRYDEMPDTLVVSRIKNLKTNNAIGINLFLPPENVTDTDGPQTNTGGSKTPDKGTGSASGGHVSGGGGGGGGGGGAGVTTAKSGAPSSYTTSATTVLNHAAALSSTQAAVKKAGTTAIVTERVAGQVSGETLRAMQQQAAAAGKSLTYQADTMNGNVVEGRMYIETARSAGIQGNLKTSIYTSAEKTAQVAKVFAKFFKNKVVLIRFDQEGALGLEVKVAVKVDLTGLNTQTLHFYAYSVKTNSYERMASPRYVVDKTGYLHFYTNVGGHILVTDTPLERK